ncbi:MAG: hypothetical protein U0031_17525 [Thermomicrobiales bacterium]
MYVFLHGAEMVPERVKARWPRARFVARARLEPRPLGATVAPLGAQYEMWGILIAIPDDGLAGEHRGVVTDDGRAFAATVPAADDTDPAAMLAAARYWELPPPYVRRLATLAAVSPEDPSDG